MRARSALEEPLSALQKCALDRDPDEASVGHFAGLGGGAKVRAAARM
jgi:hypothetical protein